MEAELHEYIDANKAQEIMQNGTAVQIIDIRSVDEYDRGHISHAVNLTWRMIDVLNTMGWDKNAVCIVAGTDGTDDAIAHAVRELTLLGFRSAVLNGGMKCWFGLGLPAVQSLARSKFCCGRGCGCS